MLLGFPAPTPQAARLGRISITRPTLTMDSLPLRIHGAAEATSDLEASRLMLPLPLERRCVRIRTRTVALLVGCDARRRHPGPGPQRPRRPAARGPARPRPPRGFGADSPLLRTCHPQ